MSEETTQEKPESRALLLRLQELAKELAEMQDIINALLQTPIRNCDVGTAEEQIKRHQEYCQKVVKLSFWSCRIYFWSCRKCFAEWSQKPYDDKPTNNNKQEESK